jgi:O-antigen ligase
MRIPLPVPSHILALGLIAVAVVSGGGYTVWSQGLIVALIGGWLLWRPPVGGGSPLLNAAGWGGIGLVGLHAMGVVSAQPWVGAETLVLLVAAIGWLFAMSALNVDPERRRRIMGQLVIVVAAAGYISALCQQLGYHYPLSPRLQTFSFFANRNQAGLFYAVGGVLAFGLALESLKRNTTRVVYNVIGCGGALLGLLISLSRAGVLLFVVGCLAWLILSLRRQRDEQRPVRWDWRGLAPLVLWLAVALLFLGGRTSERIRDMLAIGPVATGESRWVIYRDAWDMALAAPWFGHGVGNFAATFPQFSAVIPTDRQIIHPESDWLWWFTELGMAGVVLCGLLALGLWAATRQQRRQTDRYRKLAALGLALCAAHSFVDVSLHRMGILLLAGLLFGLCRISRQHDDAPLRALCLPPPVWRGIGSGLVAIGALWVLASVFGWPLHTRLVMAHAEKAVARAVVDSTGLPAARTAVRRLERARPIEWQTYALAGRLALLDGDLTTARQQFRLVQQRFPGQPRVQLMAGDWLRGVDPVEAQVYYRAVFERATPRHDLNEWFRLRLPQPLNASQVAFWEPLSRLHPDYRSLLLQRVDDPTFVRLFGRDLAARLPFEHWSPRVVMAHMRRMIRLQHRPALEAFFDRHPAMVDRYWLPAAHLRVLAGDLTQADALLAANISEPAMPVYGEKSTPAFLRGQLRFNPRDYAAAGALVRRYHADGEVRAALQLIEGLPGGNAVPRFFLYWRARLLWESGRHPESMEWWWQFDRL